jgi:hypothetical protein
MRRHNLLFTAALSISALSVPAFAGRILVNNDEWAFSQRAYDPGWAGPENTDRLVSNIANFLTGGSGKILIYSSNFGVGGAWDGTGDEPDFLQSLTNAGYSYDVDKTGEKKFEDYKAIFLAGNVGVNKHDALANYVNRGGGVFLAMGTGRVEFPSPASEAAAWNPFLHRFGLNLEPTYNLFSGTYSASPEHSIFNGVGSIYYNNGNTITLTEPRNPYASIIQKSPGQEQYGLFGVYERVETPEPQTLTLLAIGIGALIICRRRRQGV